MEIDTGIQGNLDATQLQCVGVKLCTYSGEQLPVSGKVLCDVSCNGSMYGLFLVVIATERHALLGQDSLLQIQLDWPALRCKLFTVYVI